MRNRLTYRQDINGRHGRCQTGRHVVKPTLARDSLFKKQPPLIVLVVPPTSGVGAWHGQARARSAHLDWMRAGLVTTTRVTWEPEGKIGIEQQGIEGKGRDKLEENIGNLEENIGNLEENIGNLEENIGKLEENIGTLEENIGKVEENIGKSEGNIGKLESPPPGAGGKIGKC